MEHFSNLSYNPTQDHIHDPQQVITHFSSINATALPLFLKEAVQLSRLRVNAHTPGQFLYRLYKNDSA